MNYDLKEYNKTYEKDLINLLIDICVEEHGLKEYEEDLIKHVKNCDFKKAWVLLDKNEVIATICYTERSNEIAEIKKVYIKKEYRGQGIGRTLVNNVINYIKDKGYKSIYIGTSDHFNGAKKFYEKMGFQFKFNEGNGYILELKLNQNKEGE